MSSFSYILLNVTSFQQNILNAIQTQMNIDLGNIIIGMNSEQNNDSTYNVTINTNTAATKNILQTSFNNHCFSTYTYQTSTLPFNTSQLRVKSTVFTTTDTFYLGSNVDTFGGNVTSGFLVFNFFGNTDASCYEFRIYNTTNNTVIYSSNTITNPMTIPLSMSVINEPCTFMLQLRTTNISNALALVYFQLNYTIPF